MTVAGIGRTHARPNEFIRRRRGICTAVPLSSAIRIGGGGTHEDDPLAPLHLLALPLSFL